MKVEAPVTELSRGLGVALYWQRQADVLRHELMVAKGALLRISVLCEGGKGAWLDIAAVAREGLTGKKEGP